LQQDDAANKFLRQNKLELAMNGNFQLLIKNTTPAAEARPETGEPITESEETKPGDTQVI
jgi:hypothetical protein